MSQGAAAEPDFEGATHLCQIIEQFEKFRGKPVQGSFSNLARAYLAREAEVKRLQQQIDEALQTAEGPSTLQELVACFLDRGLAAYEAEKQVGPLRDALRKLVLKVPADHWFECRLCGEKWREDPDWLERHAPGCLAAPEADGGGR